jgi:hypothetical protein
VMHRAVSTGAMETIRVRFAARRPQGAELDDAFRTAGLEAMEPASIPRVFVFWQQAGANPPQPAAVFIDAPEPLWRTRPFPAKIVDNTGPSPAERWVMGERDWLRLELKSGAPAIIAANGMIRAPGDQRALIVLAANSRGQRLQLDLVRPAVSEPYLASPEDRLTVVDIPLTKAPWEE